MNIAARLAAWLRPRVDRNPLIEQAGSLTLREVFVRFWPRVRPLRWWLALSLVFVAIAPAIEVAEILLFQRLVDDVLTPVDVDPLLGLALAYIALNVASGVLSGFDDYLGTWISQRFMVRLRADVFAHVLALPGHVHDRRRLGDVITRLTQDVATVERFMVSHLTDAIASVVRLTFLLGALFWLQWELALLSLIAAPALWWVSRHFARFTQDASRERRRRGGSLTSITEESLANASLVQLYGAERQAARAYEEQNRAIADAELAGSKVRAVFLPLVDLIELVAILLVIALGVWALGTDRLTLGGLLAFLTLLIQCYRPIRELSDLLPDLFAATAGIERVVEVLDEQPVSDRGDARPLQVTGGHVRLRGVTVTYPGAHAPAVSALNLDIAPGSTVAVTGASGSGKSTLVRLLSRVLVPQAGVVEIDGQDLAGCTGGSVRTAVTVVPQETLLLDASVADNIGLSRPGATREEIEAAARAADAHGFISRLPDGYDTRVGQRGRLLSGGQRQRLALARALLRDSPILVLDEPTTGLDAASSRRFLTALRAAGDARTVIVMTHDPLIAEWVDRVITLPTLTAQEAS
ncbi:MAG: ABC transporter ATP-binding protein [Mobilicoccus sp.]|nr:ABC transporter ATP-binding protein [Mobilicoccus sp.]